MFQIRIIRQKRYCRIDLLYGRKILCLRLRTFRGLQQLIHTGFHILLRVPIDSRRLLYRKKSLDRRDILAVLHEGHAFLKACRRDLVEFHLRQSAFRHFREFVFLKPRQNIQIRAGILIPAQFIHISVSDSIHGLPGFGIRFLLLRLMPQDLAVVDRHRVCVMGVVNALPKPLHGSVPHIPYSRGCRCQHQRQDDRFDRRFLPAPESGILFLHL